MNAWLRYLLSYELLNGWVEYCERQQAWAESRRYCESVGKPLLRIGVRRSWLEPPNGDITLDISPDVLLVSGGVQGDERAMPFRDREFGVCFNEHTLEHLEHPEDVAIAVRECCRVADRAVFLCPSPYSLYAQLFVPSHRLRLWLRDGVLYVAPNRYRTGLGVRDWPVWSNSGRLAQVIVVDGLAPVVTTHEPPLSLLRSRP